MLITALNRRPGEVRSHRRLFSSGAALVLAVLSALMLAGCGSKSVTFNYPGENLVFPNQGQPPVIYVEFVNDLRPALQRTGDGKSSDVRFPADDAWDQPVAQLYYEALTQDLTQTNAVALADALPRADYVLEVDLLNLGCAAKRSSTGWLVSGLAGAGVGWLASGNPFGGLAGAILGVGAWPVNTRLRAVCEVRLRVSDLDGNVVFEETCLGEITDSVREGMTSRKDQLWVDKYLTVAVKRCNACLVGQLRQSLVAHKNADWGRDRGH